MKHTRPIYGVICASTSNKEQRELLNGIVTQAQELDIDIAVLSSIYNSTDNSPVLQAENSIYSLILSEEFDGFILLAESITNSEIRSHIGSLLRRREDVPTVVVGASLPELGWEKFRYISNDDAADFEAITDHLVEVHGFTDIHFLTGYEIIPTSHTRAAACRSAMEKHGLTLDPKNVFFGDYWTTSGSELAKKYISGELPYPQALICANDCMAYGVLDEFMKQSVYIKDKMALIGYEHMSGRHCHTPLLTTYYRNRNELGKSAVKILYGGEKAYEEFTAPKGRFIFGTTCGCSESYADTKNEIERVHLDETYDMLNFFCQLDHRLTECHNMEEFVKICHEFQFLIRDRNKLWMCLYDNWYENGPHSEDMLCYNLIWEQPPKLFRRENISALFTEEAAVYYLCPLFFSQRELGFIALRFDHPDTFDPIFRNFLKAISNGLEILRMKNDIRYLSECQSLSQQRDTVTGMYNESTVRGLLQSEENKSVLCVVLRIGLLSGDKSVPSGGVDIDALLAAADAVREMCGTSICARVDDNTFLFTVKGKGEPSFYRDLTLSILYNHKKYIKKYGVDSAVCAVLPWTDEGYSEFKTLYTEELVRQSKELSDRRYNKNFPELYPLRNHIYTHPRETFDSDEIHSHYFGSPGHLRTIYKKCFGISFHRDCIAARIMRAKYYLAVSALNTREIAEICGYSDEKYFMRQFLSETGFTANQYRIKTK